MRRVRPLMAVMLGFVVLMLLAGPAFAQPAPIAHRIVPYQAASGAHDGGEGAAARVAYRRVVQAPGAPWIRLHLGATDLGDGSYITITSLQDHAVQRLDAVSLAQWQNWTAYFNGPAVELALHVAAGDRDVSVQVDGLMVGQAPVSTETQCGPLDDRVTSKNPAVGRIMNVGCTGWLVAGGWFLTAGHCLTSAGSVNVVQFNVPPSLINGTPQHPGPEDQYSIDVSTMTFVAGGIGNDWGVYDAFTNSTTGQTALQRQGTFFNIVANLSPPTIRITGYGVDSGTANQTQQTATGPNAGSTGQVMRYQTDSEGGNSGSPIINESTGQSVGVHTNGGCTTTGSGSNSGTSFFNTALLNAANNGPSGNPGGGCPATVALDGPSGAVDLGLLRRFRDEVLTPSAGTRAYVDLFYQHAVEIVGILVFNGDLRQRATELFREAMPGVRAALNGGGGEFVLTSSRVSRINALLAAIGAKGSPELRRSLDGLQADVLRFWGRSLKEILKVVRGQSPDRAR